MPTQPPTGSNLPNPPAVPGSTPTPGATAKRPGFGPIYNHVINLFLSHMTVEQLEDEARVAAVLRSCERAADQILDEFQRLKVAFSITANPSPWNK